MSGGAISTVLHLPLRLMPFQNRKIGLGWAIQHTKRQRELTVVTTRRSVDPAQNSSRTLIVVLPTEPVTPKRKSSFRIDAVGHMVQCLLYISYTPDAQAKISPRNLREQRLQPLQDHTSAKN